MSTTFEKYGGFKTVSRVVLTFYEKVLDSDVVGHHFDEIDMARQMDHQTKFISSIMGGPSAMSDERLAVVHHKIDITVEEFGEVCQLLAEAMREHGMEEDDVVGISRIIAEKRGLILRPGL
ncbi:MAG: group 1 truncated hemoglobin [Pseudomonadota bacterium]